MRTIASLLLVVLTGYTAGCVTSSSSSTGGSSASPMVGGEPVGKLYIEYNENNPEIRAERYNTINNENDRYHYLKRSYERVLQDLLPGYELEFQRFPIKAPEDANILELTFLSLRSPTRIELELRVWAKLRQGEDVQDFGITLSRIVPQRPMTSSSVDRDLDGIYTNSAKEVVKKVADIL